MTVVVIEIGGSPAVQVTRLPQSVLEELRETKAKLAEVVAELNEIGVDRRRVSR